MNEPHSFVDVADAFDEDDPFDLNIRLGYRYQYTYGDIQREGGTLTTGDPHRQARNWVDVARFSQSRNILDLGLDVGIFRDLALFARMPITLSDDRSLAQVDSPTAGLLQADADGDGDPTNDPPLFNVPFNSPTRSGLDYIEAGLAWSIFNQHRDRALPTWVLMISGRFNVGDPLIPCDGTSGTPNCREWAQDPSTGLWNFTDGGGDAGETRGTNGLRIETRASWRSGYVEPYAGLLFSVEWPASAERFFLPAGNIQGIINQQPPLQGTLTGGMAIHPWEDRSSFQRFTIDFRFMGKYTSEGHGYSSLFDALGTSRNRYLTEPNVEGDPDGVADLRTVPFFGLTDTQPYASLGARVALEMRAARFVSFSLGGSAWYIEPHTITYTDACNPNVSGIPDSDPRRGTCRQGIINPQHRPAIDLPGRTFRQNETVQLELNFRVQALF